MIKVENNLVTPSEFSKLIVIAIIGTGIFSLPNDMVKVAKWDGWISVIVGVIYPLYIAFTAIFLSRKHPQENILVLNKIYFGKILGSILNMLFLLVFIFYLTSEATGLSNFLRTYIIDYLTNIRFLILFIAATAFTAYKGLKVLGRMGEIVFYGLILTGAIAILSLQKASIYNIMPAFGAGWINILKGIKESIYNYSGIELILLVYPSINDKSKFKKTCLKSILIVCISYIWVTFTTIFYLGHNTIQKTPWATLYVIESLRLPIINNFRIVVMVFWIFVSAMATAVEYYSIELILRNTFKSLKRNWLYILSIPIMVALCMLYGDEVRRREVIDMITPAIVIFNIINISLLALLVYFNKDKACE